MLETMRQYGEDRLEELGEADAWRRRLAEHFGDFAVAAGAGLKSRAEPAWRSRLHLELDNLRAAVMWALDRAGDDAQLGLRIIAPLAWESNRGDVIGVASWAERAINAARLAPRGMRSDVLSAASWAAVNRGDLDEASARVSEALEQGTPAEADSPAAPYVMLGYVRMLLGDLQGAIKVTEDGLRVVEADAGDRLAERGMLVTTLAGWRFFAGDAGGARADAAHAVALSRELGAPSVMSMALFIEAITFWRDDPAGATPLIDESIELIESGEAADAFYPLVAAVRARVRALQGDGAGACRALGDGLEHARRKGDQPMLATVLGYAIPVIRDFDALDIVALLGGAVYEGPLAFLRNVPPPEDQGRATRWRRPAASWATRSTTRPRLAAPQCRRTRSPSSCSPSSTASSPPSADPAPAADRATPHEHVTRHRYFRLRCHVLGGGGGQCVV